MYLALTVVSLSHITHRYRQQCGNSQKERGEGVGGVGKGGRGGGADRDRKRLCLGQWVHDVVCR